MTFIIFDRFAFDLVDQIAGPLCLRRGSDHELGVVVQRGQPAGDVAGGVFEGFWVVHAGWAHRREEVICATSSSRAYLPELKWSKAAMPGRSSREGWPVERPASWNAVA